MYAIAWARIARHSEIVLITSGYGGKIGISMQRIIRLSLEVATGS